MFFEYTSREKRMWRGWLKNGQSLELNWFERSWEFGAGILVHANDCDKGNRMLCVKLGWFSAYIPLGITKYSLSIDSEPQWSAFASKEFGFVVHWNKKRWSYDWPWSWLTIAYEKKTNDGEWVDVFSEDLPYVEMHNYNYTLNSGRVQNRLATVSLRRHIIGYKFWLCRKLGWPQWTKNSIDVNFDEEVGEGEGSWKGGTLGCGYEMDKGEDLYATLKRMEKERRFR